MLAIRCCGAVGLFIRHHDIERDISSRRQILLRELGFHVLTRGCHGLANFRINHIWLDDVVRTVDLGQVLALNARFLWPCISRQIQ